MTNQHEQYSASALDSIRDALRSGKTSLGIELGSTRIKACLIGTDGTVLASMSYGPEGGRDQAHDGVTSLASSPSVRPADAGSRAASEAVHSGAAGRPRT